MASKFKVPVFSDEQLREMERRSMEWERAETERILNERRARANIPRRFEHADLCNCPQRLGDWVFHGIGSPGIMLRGRVGRGKTYAACAMLNVAIQSHGVLFATFGDILRECKATFGGFGTERDVIDRYTGVPLLAIDDFGKENMTEWALPIVFAVIDKRHSSGRRTIITTQYGSLAQRLSIPGNEDTALAIASRLSEYEVVEFNGPDRRLACLTIS